MKLYSILFGLILIFCISAGVGRQAGAPKFGVNGKPLCRTVGVTHTGASYTMDSRVDCLQEGAGRILDMGSEVIKLWFADTTVMKYCYPYNIRWNELGIADAVDLARCEYFARVFDMGFSTYILETSTFDFSRPDVNVVWQDGMTPEECSRVEREMYDLASYLMTRYNGTGKEFVLQNWEGDNMLEGIQWRYDNVSGLYYKAEKGAASACEADDRELRVRIEGLTDWFNCRQRGVDRARAELQGKTDVLVRNALEVSFVYLDSQDDGWPFTDTPILIDHVIGYTDCDLYSYSSWATHTVKRAQDLKAKLEIIGQRLGDTYIDIYDRNSVKPRRPYLRKGQVSRLMLGEYGSIEGMQYADTLLWGRGFTDETNRRHRTVLQIQTDIAQAMGLEYVVFWQLYCNVYRGDILTDVVDMVKGDQIQKNEHLQGNWLIRVDGTCTEGYKYLRGLCRPVEALYPAARYSRNRMYSIGSENGGFEISTTQTADFVPVNLTDRGDYNGNVRIYGSEDGKRFMPVETECFFTDYRISGETVDVDVIYIDKERPRSAYRYFRIETSDNTEVNGVKFYKPVPTIAKR